MLAVQVWVTKSFAIFTVHFVRPKTEDPNTAHQATHVHLYTLLINKIMIKRNKAQLARGKSSGSASGKGKVNDPCTTLCHDDRSSVERCVPRCCQQLSCHESCYALCVS